MSDTTVQKCARKACSAQLDGPHAAIWNDFSTDQPRLYCVPCGRRIIEGNRHDELKLKHEFRNGQAS